MGTIGGLSTGMFILYLWIGCGFAAGAMLIWDMIEKKHFRNFFADCDGKRNVNDPILLTVFLVVFTFIICEVFGLAGFVLYQANSRRR